MINYKQKSLARKLVASIFVVIVATMGVSIVVNAIFLNEIHKKEAFKNLQDYAQLFEESHSTLPQNPLDSAYRISIISLNGRVLFDNKFDKNTLDNHQMREEVLGLAHKKSATSMRKSRNENRENLYFAKIIWLDSSEVILRVSIEREGLFYYLKNLTPLFIILTILSAIFSVILGAFLTQKIIQPIKNINLSHPIRTNPYAELHIFMQKISRQKKRIKKQYKKLKQREMAFEIITQNMNEGFLVLDSSIKVKKCNNKAREILQNALLGDTLADDFAKKIIDSLEAKSAFFECNVGEVFIQAICMPIFVKENLKAAIVLLFDKTREKDALILRREFSANVTHELKTPLSVILASSEMLLNGLVEAKDKDLFIEKIYAESKRLLCLIDKILKISFLDEAQDFGEKGRVFLDTIIRQIAPNIEALAHSKNIKITYNLTPCEINGIAPLLEDMIYNLCENAIKYSEENGAISVELWGDSSDSCDSCDFGASLDSRESSAIRDSSNSCNVVQLRIKDNGIGIAKHEQNRIFERFYCVDKSRSKKLGGSGLGLAIVKHIVRIHNAKVRVNSDIGKGCEMIVEFKTNDLK